MYEIKPKSKTNFYYMQIAQRAVHYVFSFEKDYPWTDTLLDEANDLSDALYENLYAISSRARYDSLRGVKYFEFEDTSLNIFSDYPGVWMVE